MRGDRSGAEYALTGANSLKGFRDQNLAVTATIRNVLRHADVCKWNKALSEPGAKLPAAKPASQGQAHRLRPEKSLR